jgi:hypothetical protein
LIEAASECRAVQPVNPNGGGRADDVSATLVSMDTGTKKKVFWTGLIIFIGVPVLCYGVGLALTWLYDTTGIWIGARND